MKLDLDTSVYPLVYNGTNVDKDSGERIKIGQAIDPDSQTTVVKIYLYADNGTMITNEDAPIILNINKKSEDANISSVTINPDTVYENSDSTERLDENQIPGFTVFANEDLDNPKKNLIQRHLQLNYQALRLNLLLTQARLNMSQTLTET